MKPMNIVVLIRACLLALPLCVMLFSAINGESASFDCSKSRTFQEKAICADPQLSELDEKLDAAYKQALKISRHPEDLKKGQKEWIKKERNPCRDAAWMKIIYQQRINNLERLMASERNARESQSILPKEWEKVLERQIQSRLTCMMY